jgi:hypothetical protein
LSRCACTSARTASDCGVISIRLPFLVAYPLTVI